MNKNQLANKIWASANKMRSKIEANEYKDYILGFIFYKYLSDKELTFLLQEAYVEEDQLPQVTEANSEIIEPDYVQRSIGYFISYEHLFSTWIAQGRDFNVANIRDALSAFERLIHPEYKKLFGGIFETLHTGLSKLGASEAEQSRAVRELLALIRDIPTDGRQDYDVLGFIYEYLISSFAANAGKKAGEFYTPHEVSVLMSDIIAHHLRHQDEIRIYDPTSGSGSLLINIGKSVARHVANKDSIKYYAQELKQATFNLTRMNLIMRGIKASNIEVRNGDTLAEDWPYFDESDPQGTYDLLYVDAVVSNPPYSQEWDPTDQENEPRYAAFGLAPKGKADFAFLLHDLYHIKPHGIMTIVLPHGVLYRGDSELQIRKGLIEQNHIDAIIGLPEKVFFGTGISTIVMVLKRPETRVDDKVLFIDASRGYVKDGKNNKLRARDIRLIVDTVTQRQERSNYAQLVSRDEIRTNDYNLNITRYVDSAPQPERYDIYATMFGGIPQQELMRLAPYWTAFPSLHTEVLEQNEEGYSWLRSENPREVIDANADVQAFKDNYRQAFSDFGLFLGNTIVTPMLTLAVVQAEDKVKAELFHRLKSFTLIDPYEAYQIFNDEWQQIATDLEILQTEGMDAVRIVDPLMVLKKKDGREEEVQEGWTGRLFPFDLVQCELLPERLTAIEELTHRLEDIDSTLETLIEGLSPEEQEGAILNDDNTKFVLKEVREAAKHIDSQIYTEEIALLERFPSAKQDKEAFIAQHPHLGWELVPPGKSGYGKTQVKRMIDRIKADYSFEEGSYEHTIRTALSLLTEADAKKKQRKKEQQDLEQETIKTIKSITDEQAIDLLRTKWLAPLLDALANMSEEVLTTLVKELMRISEKYATSYADITKRITTAESRLHTLIGELEGSTADSLGLTAFRNTLKK